MTDERNRRQVLISTSAALTLSALPGPNSKGDQPGNQPFLVRKGEAHKGRPLTIQGDLEAFATKVRGIDGNKTYLMIEAHTPPNRGPLLHIHRSENELFVVLYGSVGIQFGSERIILNVGDTFMVPANMPHAFLSLGKEESRILLIFDPPGDMESFFVDLATALNENPDQQKLISVYTKYGIKVVGPQLEASSFGVSKA